jgi:cellulose biosynthesis protein BcsQ
MVFGADVDRDVLFTEDQIQTYYCDQLDGNAIRDLWSQPALQSEMDILIEDGLHTFPANVSFLDGSLERVRVGGTYIVEDIRRNDLPMWHRQLPIYAKQFSNFDFVLVELPNALNDYDNNLLIIRRRS